MKKAVSFGKEKHEDEEAVMLLLLLLLFLSLSWSETTERWNLLLLLLLLMFWSALSLPLFLTTVFVSSTTWIQFSPSESSKGLALLRRDESQTMNWDCNLLLFSLLLVVEEDEEEPASTASSGRLLWFMMMIFLVVWRVSSSEFEDLLAALSLKELKFLLPGVRLLFQNGNRL